MDTRIYVMTHKVISEIPDEMYIPLHVGKAGKESFGYLGDDTGDNISEKNENYCELTGMYWIWKNVSCDIVGICHYRRFFVRNEKILEKSYIEERLQKYGIIVPSSCCVKEKNVYDHYRDRHEIKDLELCRNIIAEKYPKYLMAFDFAMQTTLVSVGNMWITKKEIYDRYCAWLFNILFEVEKRIDMTGYDAYQRRVMGFLSERLFRVWLLMQPEAITEEQMKMIEPSEFRNAERRVELVYQCVKLKIAPILQLYKGGISESLAKTFACSDDFEGKIPVWVCWWQGEAEMPEIIQCCIESIHRNIPKEKMVLRLVTLENCMRYVTFTEAIIRKYNEGKIPMTHLSNILRAELLYRYGGMWIDATYYVAKKIPMEIFEKNLYTIRFEETTFGADITRGRWTENLWYTHSGYKLFQFLMEALWYYWETENELIDYYLTDDIVAIAVEAFPEIGIELENCSCSCKKIYELQHQLNKPCTVARIEKLLVESVFYKLNSRSELRKTTMAGVKTVYGYLIETMEM